MMRILNTFIIAALYDSKQPIKSSISTLRSNLLKKTILNIAILTIAFFFTSYAHADTVNSGCTVSKADRSDTGWDGCFDVDSYTNGEETASKSIHINGASIPGKSSVGLRKGLNRIYFSTGVLLYESVEELIEGMNGSDVIDQVLIFNSGTQAYRSAGYASDDNYFFVARKSIIRI